MPGTTTNTDLFSTERRTSILKDLHEKLQTIGSELCPSSSVKTYQAEIGKAYIQISRLVDDYIFYVEEMFERPEVREAIFELAKSGDYNPNDNDSTRLIYQGHMQSLIRVSGRIVNPSANLITSPYDTIFELRIHTDEEALKDRTPLTPTDRLRADRWLVTAEAFFK